MIKYITLTLLCLILHTSALRFRPSVIAQTTAELLASKANGQSERERLVVGNWKCNGRVSELPALLEWLNSAAVKESKAKVVVAPPYVHLSAVQASLPPSVSLGAQDVAVSVGYGAYTGEVSGDMLRDVGVEFVIVGHSERRAGFSLQQGENEGAVGEKTKAALAQGLRPIVCVGETLRDRESGRTMAVISSQLAAVAAAIDAKDWRKGVLVAYEPVWAIGTGRSATPQQAQEVHSAIRAWLGDHVSRDAAATTPLLYGGSVKANNAKSLAEQPDVDGFLVGGAALTGEFPDIVAAMQ